MFAQVKTLEDRIRLSLVHAEPRVKEKELAKKLGRSDVWFCGVKKGKWKADKELREAAKILGVPEDWLIHGTGPAPTWAPKPPPEQESLQKSMDLILKVVEQQSHQIEELKVMVSHLLKSGTHPPTDHAPHGPGRKLGKYTPVDAT